MTINKASPTGFKLDFPLIPKTETLDEQSNFTLHIFETVLPSRNLTLVEIPYRGNSVYDVGGGVEFGDWSVSFHIDESWESYLLIYNWMESINNGRDIFGRKDYSYQVDAILTILDNYENPFLEFVFRNIWPYALGEVSFSYKKQQSAVLIGNTTFSYDYFYKK